MLVSKQLCLLRQDEVIADDGKFVLRVNDLLHWVVAASANRPPTDSSSDLLNGCQAPAEYSIAKCNAIRSTTLDTYSPSSKRKHNKLMALCCSIAACELLAFFLFAECIANVLINCPEQCGDNQVSNVCGHEGAIFF